jgi:hypothetical protein
MLPGMTCSLTSKDITIVAGFIPPSGISPLNRRSAKLLDPVSTKLGEGQIDAALKAKIALEHSIDEPSRRHLRDLGAVHAERRDSSLPISVNSSRHFS